jgi:hypothetical protein
MGADRLPQTPPGDPLGALLDRLQARLESVALREGAAGLREAVRSLQKGAAPTAVLAMFASMSRRVGRAPIPTGPVLEGPEDLVSLEGWAADEVGRVALLLAVAAGSPPALPLVVESAFRDGDTREKTAIVRGLSLLPGAGRFLTLALDAGRTNETTLFRALACDNPFPARHYPDLELSKLVMKAVFLGSAVAPLDRIIGLGRRATPELARMGLDYIAQQESAGRDFPPEIWLAIAPHPPPGAVGGMLGYLRHSVAAHRRGAALGLALAAQERTRSFLLERLAVETDGDVTAQLRRTLEALPNQGAG